MADAQNNSMTEYVIRTPGCSPHQQTPFISKFLAAETPPPLVTELVAGTCCEPSLKISGAQVDAARAALDSFSEKNRFFIERGGVRTLTSKAFVLGDVMGFGKTAVLTTLLVETMYKNQTKTGKLGRHVILIPKIEHSTQFFDSIKPMLGLPVISAVLRKGSIPFFMDAKHVYKSVPVDKDQTDENTDETETLVPAVGDGVLITTYLGIGRHSTGIASWVGGSSAGTDTFFSFDESHHLKDLKTKSAAGATELLNTFPLANVIFSSATGAETIAQFFLPGLRLGLWTESTFSKSIAGGRNFFSYVGIQLYKEGSYISRMLDTSVVCKEKRIVVSLSTEERAMYDSCARLMCKTMRSISLYAFEDARTVSMRVYSAQICFFRELIVLVKMEKCIEEAKRMLRNNYAVAIAIQTTGEAWIDGSKTKTSGAENDGGDGGGDGGDDDVGQGLLNILRGLFECVKKNDKSKAGWPLWDSLWQEWIALGLPDRAVIDVVIDRLGGLDVVADATGRRRQFVRRASLDVADAGDEWVCKTRPVTEGEIERQAFQDAKKFCCVTSKKIAEGFNLHRVSAKNAFGEEISRDRGLIILDPPWGGLFLKQLIGRVGRTGQLSSPLIVFLDLADVIELSFAGRHASQTRNHSSLTQGHMNVTSICDELSDLRATRGARAIRKTIFDLKDTMQYRTTDVREALGVDSDAFRSYCERAVRSLTDAGAISCLAEKRKAKRRRDGAGDAGDEEYDASEATSEADGEAVKQFLNRILSVEIDVQHMLAKHLSFRLTCVQEQSSHLKPIAPSFNCFRTVSIVPGVDLKFYLGLIPFDAVRALDATYPGGTLGVSPCFSKVAFVVKIRSVTWKITANDVFARGAMPLTYEKIGFSDDGIRDIWQRGCSTKLMLHGLPVKDIHPLRKKLADELCSTTKMTLTRIDNEDGTPLIAFALEPDCVPVVKDYFSDSGAGSSGNAGDAESISESESEI